MARRGLRRSALGLATLALAGAYAFARRTREYELVAKELRSPLSRFRSPSFGPLILPLIQAGSRRSSQPVHGVEVEAKQISVDDGAALTVYIYRPRGLTLGGAALFHTHGGGMVAGSAQSYHTQASTYARDLGMVVINPDYRLAPQHPFPTPLDDVYAAYRWLIGAAVELGVAADRIVVMGDSAGAGLTASLCQRIRDAGDPLPVLQALIYPMLDDRSAITPEDARGQIVWTRKSNRFGWSSYLGQPAGGESVPGYAVPAREDDLRGLPPAWIGVGTLDLFYEEDVAYANRLLEAGVACKLVEVDGAFHAFDAMFPLASIVRTFRNDMLDAIRRATTHPL